MHQTLRISNFICNCARVWRVLSGARSGQALPMLLFTLLALLVNPAVAQASPVRILVVLSESRGFHAEFLTALKPQVPSGMFLQTVDAADLAKAHGLSPSPPLVIVVGAAALQAVLDRQSPVATGTPVLVVMTPRSSIERIAASRPDWPVHAVWLEPKAASLMRLFGSVLPGRERLGLLLGPDSDEHPAAQAEPGLVALRRLAERQGVLIDLVRISKESELPNALLGMLPRVDALLLYPDRVTYTRTSLRLILQLARRHAVPVLGVSQGAVQAGALAAVYVSPAQAAAEVGDLLISLDSRHSTLPPSDHSSRYSVAINPVVARLLQLQLPAPDVVAKAVGAAPAAQGP